MEKRTLLSIMGGISVLLVIGCGAGVDSPDDPGDGSGGTGGNISGAVTNEEGFITNFLNIVCGPSETEGAMPQACDMGNEPAVDLYSCLWSRADFDNDGSQTPPSEKTLTDLSEGGATPLCAKLNTPGYTCSSWMGFAFKSDNNQFIGNIWQNSDPKPTNPGGMLGTCNIP